MFFPVSDRNPRLSPPIVTGSLIVACVIIFLLSLPDFESVIFAFGFTPAAATVTTVFTSMFLHGGVDHIFGNMWYLWLFGDNVESVFGKIHYIGFYFLSGMAATAAHYFTNLGSDIPAIGASGAISGVLGAYMVFFPNVRVKVYSRYGGAFEMSALGLLGLWFLMQLLFSTVSLVGGAGSGIAFSAHAGGFIFGYAYAQVFKWVAPKRIPKVQDFWG